MIIRRLLLSFLSIHLSYAQWGGFFGGWPQQPQPQWPQQQWNQQPQQKPQQIFPQNNFFNQFTLAPPPVTTTTTTAAPFRLEDVPNPDLEQGNWPLPNPANWPEGPDWNDERNSWKGEFGWGGKDQNRLMTSEDVHSDGNK